MAFSPEVHSGFRNMLTSNPRQGMSLVAALTQHSAGTTATTQSLDNLLDQMGQNPAAAPTYAALIAALPNVPQSVIVEVNGAVTVASDKVAYAEAMTRAKSALTSSVPASTGIAGFLDGIL